MMGFPGVQVAGHVNGFPIRPGLGGEVFDLLTGHIADDLPFVVAEDSPVDAVQVVDAFFGNAGDEFFERQFTFPRDDHIGSGIQVRLGIGDRLRPTKYDLRPLRLTIPHHGQDVLFGHQVAVQAYEGRARGLHMGTEIGQGVEGAVPQIHGKPFGLEVGRNVQQPQRGVGLHDLPFVFIFGDEVAVTK